MLFALFLACHSSAPPLTNPASPSVILEGTILHKPWSQTPESWVAGGSDYYVLDVGSASVAERSAEEGVILRASPTVPVQRFEEMTGKKVTVQGHYVDSHPLDVSPEGNYPMGPDGKPMPTGAGFVVESLTP